MNTAHGHLLGCARGLRLATFDDDEVRWLHDGLLADPSQRGEPDHPRREALVLELKTELAMRAAA